MKTKTLVYWGSTAILAFALTAGGVGDLLHPKAIDEGMAHLGYPPYFATILGVWKLPGAAVLLAPRLPRLKEWAYAGAFFDMSGAVASHIFSGDTVVQYLWPLFFAVCVITSWATRPESRVLGALFPPKDEAKPAIRHETESGEGRSDDRFPVAGGTI